jgi:hypothetical protein
VPLSDNGETYLRDFGGVVVGVRMRRRRIQEVYTPARCRWGLSLREALARLETGT